MNHEVVCPYGKCDMVLDHDVTIKKHTEDIGELKIKEAVLGTKLDLTNKLLGGILIILATATVGLLFEILKKGVL